MKIKALLDKKFKLGKKVIKYNNKLVDIREEIRNIEVQLEEFKKNKY